MLNTNDQAPGFAFEKEDLQEIEAQLESAARMNTEGHYDDDDNLSVFSESVVEREGETRNLNLIQPEADDDTFFEIQSQRSISQVSTRRDGLNRTNTDNKIEEERKDIKDVQHLLGSGKDVKIGQHLLGALNSRSAMHTGLAASVAEPCRENDALSMGMQDRSNASRMTVPVRKNTQDKVHVGNQDSKFAQMFQEGIKNFRIRQDAKDRAHQAFGLMDPSLLKGKYVVYKVTGQD